ncbi:hypothetical protein MKZ38_009906 [Zalerion maritima]|uniref:Uncharacterized protein n=1 Tax=Zalerion maritima TaxID=339359 RepID=A0AAD5RGW1_9PEZI|nr:hypothetical protein MKZ38_009906 [Zalerion maritima]
MSSPTTPSQQLTIQSQKQQLAELLQKLKDANSFLSELSHMLREASVFWTPLTALGSPSQVSRHPDGTPATNNSKAREWLEMHNQADFNFHVVNTRVAEAKTFGARLDSGKEFPAAQWNEICQTWNMVLADAWRFLEARML